MRDFFLRIVVRVSLAGSRREDTGASLIEYALLVALIALVCIGGLRYFQQQTAASFSKSASSISSAG